MAVWVALLAIVTLPNAAWLLDDDILSARLAAVAVIVSTATLLRLARLQPLSPAMIYLYVLSLFHLGSVVLWSFGLTPGDAPGRLLVYRLTPALTLTILAITSFQLGAAWASRRQSDARQLLRPRRQSDSIVYHCGIAILTIGIAALLIGVARLGWERLASATYFETYRLQHHFDPRFFVTSLYVVPIRLYLATAAGQWRRLPPVCGIGLVWASALFYLGFRGFALIPALTVLAILVKRGLKVPRSAYAVGVIALLILISSVRVMRESRLSDRGLWGGISYEAPTAALHELGGSILPLIHTIRLMQNEEWRLGSTYVQALGEPIPNISLDWQPDRFVPTEHLPPSHWVTKLAAPWSYRNYGGLGFSAVAEPYMNFGIPGVAAFFMLLGWALVRAERLGSSGPYTIAAWAMVLGPLLWTTRNASLVFFRPAAWGLLALAVAILVARSMRQLKRPLPVRYRPIAQVVES